MPHSPHQPSASTPPLPLALHPPLAALLSFILHLDKQLAALIAQHGPNSVYALLFAIVFCETGLVLTPFLPGDSLLFAAGAFAGACCSVGLVGRVGPQRLQLGVQSCPLPAYLPVCRAAHLPWRAGVWLAARYGLHAFGCLAAPHVSSNPSAP